MTANALTEERRACTDAGMDAYVSKPVMLDSLAQALVATPRRAGAGPSSASAPPVPQIDASVLNELRTFGTETFVEIVEAFLSDSTTLVASLDAAVASSNGAELRRAAHSLKATSGAVGAKRLAEAAEVLERLALAGNLSLTLRPKELLKELHLAATRELRAVLRG
jgi:HPt (histidine-containing phosphotransfer) domain-containing protein